MAPLPFQSGVSKDIATGVMATLVIFSVSVFMPVVGSSSPCSFPCRFFFTGPNWAGACGMVVPLVAYCGDGPCFRWCHDGHPLFFRAHVSGFRHERDVRKRAFRGDDRRGRLRHGARGRPDRHPAIQHRGQHGDIRPGFRLRRHRTWRCLSTCIKVSACPQETIDAISGSWTRFNMYWFGYCRRWPSRPPCSWPGQI
jgi:hypothetical protein